MSENSFNNGILSPFEPCVLLFMGLEPRKFETKEGSRKSWSQFLQMREILRFQSIFRIPTSVLMKMILDVLSNYVNGDWMESSFVVLNSEDCERLIFTKVQDSEILIMTSVFRLAKENGRSLACY